MSTYQSGFRSLLRSTAILIALGGGIALAGAQEAAQSAYQTKTEATPALQVPALATTGDQLFSSSSASNDDATAPTSVATLNPTSGNPFANFMQYGGGQRRRYGAPRYRGSNTTADGTPKYAFFAGAGLNQPTGNTWHYFTPSYAFQVGGGRNFNRQVGLMVQFDWDSLNLSKSTLSNQSDIYFGDPAAADNGLDGSSHVWSFSLDPVFNLVSADKGGFGAYAVGGVGFYHKATVFTVPTAVTGYSPYYGFYGYTANEPIDKYASNAPGFSGGFGATYKFSRFSNERFYVEARYVVTLNSNRPGYIVNSSGQLVATGANADPNNYFPANSHRTTYIPIKFGLRF